MKVLTIFTCIFLLWSNSAYSKDYYDKKINNVQVNASNGCIYFTLEGVGEADPISPGQPWITVSPQNEYKQEVLSLVMAAKLANSSVKVVTSGEKICGYAGLHYVRLTN